MSLARYRYFEKVARLGSIREAAEVLHIAPSAISRQIAHLENEYGTDLFERESRGMRLTSAGEIVLQSARTLLDGVDKAKSALDDLQGLRRGHVKIWSVEGMLIDFVYPALARFCAQYPAVTYELMVASSDQLIDRLLEDEADVAIAFNPKPNRHIQTVAEIADPLVAIAAPNHPATRERNLSLGDLTRWPLAMPDETFGMRHLIDEAAAAAKIQIRPLVTTNSIESLRSFARVGMGLSVLTRLAVQRDVELRRLVTIALRDRRVRAAKVKVCVRRDRHLSAAASALARFLGTAGKAAGSKA